MCQINWSVHWHIFFDFLQSHKINWLPNMLVMSILETTEMKVASNLVKSCYMYYFILCIIWWIRKIEFPGAFVFEFDYNLIFVWRIAYIYNNDHWVILRNQHLFWISKSCKHLVITNYILLIAILIDRTCW